MRRRAIHPDFLRLAIFTGCLALLAPGPHAAIKFTNAFPGVTFARPVYFGAFPGKSDTFVALEQHKGQVVVLSRKGAGWSKDTLLKLDVNQADEQGLLGIAFHPGFAHNRKYYISYDPPANYSNILEERLADSTLLKDSGTKGRILIKIADKYSNHNGGTIAFGPKDGFLYFGTGDGGSGNDPDGNGQNKNVLLGKMLRIDVDKKDTGLEYGIPADNPFAEGGGRKEIFAYGLRNPWKWSFDPVTGDLWLGDVGQDTLEEVDILTKGGNYGWHDMEGPFGTNNGSMIPPIFSYDHDVGSCIIGGVVFRGAAASKYYGTYFVADINSKQVWNLRKNGADPATVELIGTAPAGFSSFGTDASGRIYLCALNSGIIYFMDSPDLAAGTGVRGPADRPGFRARRAFAAAQGSRLDPSAFAGSGRLRLFSLDGARIGSPTLTRETPTLPKGLKAGCYLLRDEAAPGDPYLLMVR